MGKEEQRRGRKMALPFFIESLFHAFFLLVIANLVSQPAPKNSR